MSVRILLLFALLALLTVALGITGIFVMVYQPIWRGIVALVFAILVYLLTWLQPRMWRLFATINAILCSLCVTFFYFHGAFATDKIWWPALKFGLLYSIVIFLILSGIARVISILVKSRDQMTTRNY